jgi:hypothetical protein
MDENANVPNPADMASVTREAMVQSAPLAAQRAGKIGLPRRRAHRGGVTPSGAIRRNCGSA